MGKDKGKGDTGKQQGESDRDRSARLERLAAKTGKPLDEVVDLDNQMRNLDR